MLYYTYYYATKGVASCLCSLFNGLALENHPILVNPSTKLRAIASLTNTNRQFLENQLDASSTKICSMFKNGISRTIACSSDQSRFLLGCSNIPDQPNFEKIIQNF